MHVRVRILTRLSVLVAFALNASVSILPAANPSIDPLLPPSLTETGEFVCVSPLSLPRYSGFISNVKKRQKALV